MIIAVAVIAVLCLGAPISLRWMRHTFLLLEKIVYYMAAATSIQQLHSVVPDNFKLFKIADTASAFTIFKLSQLVLFPLLTVWLLYGLFRLRDRFFLKILLSAAWVLLLTGLYGLYERIGVMDFTGWKTKHAIVMWLAVLAETALFCVWFRMLLRKSGKRDAVST